MNKNYCIITTINSPTKAIEVLYEKFGSNLIVVGDKKTPNGWEYKDAQYITTLREVDYAPYNHYARKNLGYMEAIRNNAKIIYEIDDDNIPNPAWKYRDNFILAQEAIQEGWVNVYRICSDEHIWPRGFSLRHLNKYSSSEFNMHRFSSIQQGLADGEPDVDAIWRLTFNKKHCFSKNRSVYLKAGSWCPFNSQSTWWFPKAYALMYLPVNAPFRMTDIWRSFIAQRCLWEIGEGVTFHSPSEVYQDRNEHDLLADFEDEIKGYLKNDLIVETLQSLKLKERRDYICDNLLTCYEALVGIDILPKEEIQSVKSWIKDYGNATHS